VTEKAPLFWVRKIASHLQELDHVPLFGNAPEFDWEKFSTEVASRLGVSELRINPIMEEWRGADRLNEGVGSDPVVLPLKISPFTGSAFWIMPKSSILKLTSWMINGQIKNRPLSAEVLTTGFYRFLALQVLDAASTLEPIKQTSPILSEHSSMPQTDAFCIDIQIGFDDHTCWGRLAIEPELQKSWAKFFANPPLRTLLAGPAKTAELTLGVKVGSSLLQTHEWQNLKPGDFVLLDRGGYDPRKHQGEAYLTLGASPLFQVKIKQNKVQLIDYASVHEDPMAENNTEATSVSEATESNVSLKDVPINLTIELSRIRMTLEKLMQLAPGNLLELPIQPEQAVKLTVNGQQVGQGELIHLGENLGVRILSLN
jgi:flagellar motor switch protein FliN/FliY